VTLFSLTKRMTRLLGIFANKAQVRRTECALTTNSVSRVKGIRQV
jgi:hypothetical protein